MSNQIRTDKFYCDQRPKKVKEDILHDSGHTSTLVAKERNETMESYAL